MNQHDTLKLEPGSARHFIEWCKAQPEDREPTTLECALAEFEASLSATQPAQAAQPAPVVPDVQREIAAALALFPIDLVIQTFRVNSYNQSQVIEADGDTQFFSKKKVMALLEKLHGHLTAAAAPTPPAQAAADARDAILFESSRWGGADCRLAVWESLRILGSRMGVTVTKEDQYTALATHQQRQDGGEGK